MQLLVLLAITFTSVYADLTCLQWGVFITTAGAWCHFDHKTYSAAENATIASIEGIAKSAVDVGNFTVTHHPVRLAYDFAPTAARNGNAEAISQLKSSGKDMLSADFGFGKESANITLTVYSLSHWANLSYCLITSAVAANNALPNTNVQLSMSAGEDVAKSCLTEKFKKVATPALFNITEKNQKVGSSLAQLASLLQPVGADKEGAKLALNTFDLAIPGAEDTIRISTRVGDSTVAAPFADEKEALGVRGKLTDSEWTNKNCIECRSTATKSATSRRKRRRGQLERRVDLGPPALCCLKVPDWYIDYGQTGFDDPGEIGSPSRSSDAGSQAPVPMDVYDPQNSQYLPESSLKPAPLNHQLMQPESWELTSVQDEFRTQTLQRVKDHGVASIGWTVGVTNDFDSADVFTFLRDIVTRQSDPVLKKIYDHMGFAESRSAAPGEAITVSPRFDDFEDVAQHSLHESNFNKLKFFDHSIQVQALDLVDDLLGYSLKDAQMLKIDVLYTWIAPAPAPKTAAEAIAIAADPFNTNNNRNFATDAGLFTLHAADHTGLVVEGPNGAYRVPVFNDVWTLIPGRTWDENNLPRVENAHIRKGAATRHAIFEPEIAAQGYFGISVRVRDPARSDAILQPDQEYFGTGGPGAIGMTA